MTVAIHLVDVRRHVAGFTALELIVSLAISTVIVIATIGFIRTSGNNAVEIWRDAQTQSTMRYLESRIKSDFRQTSATKLNLIRPNDDNHTIQLQRTLAASGSAPGTVWGAYARELGATESERRKPGWSVRYRVIPVTKSGVLDRQLVREYLNASNAVQHTETLAHFLEAGTGPKPGFKIEPTGAMWKITVSAREKSNLTALWSFDFRVSCKN